ncbi:MAG: hypothetical protein P4L52_00790 [Acidocella sp.]|nr:hypothetical protein [Acidocella sp.]
MDFIFMLTRQDRTVPDCLEVLAEIAPLSLRHIGFKDIGADTETLRRLHAGIKALGALSYLEVVATSPEAALRSARMGVELGVDRLLGGTLVAETLEILRGTKVEYYPFPGLPVGHPTRLGGDEARIEADTARFIAQGCAGVDLLAYRATEAEPLELVRAARKGCGSGRLICAGSVDSPARIAALRAAGADGFTIGSAVFDGSFAPGAGGVAAQLREVLACV